MARLPDPTTLDDRDAAEVRKLARTLRVLKKLTNEQIAVKLDCDERAVRYFLDENRRLLGKNALVRLKALADLGARGSIKDRVAADLLLLRFWPQAKWLTLLQSQDRLPAVVIPVNEAQRFAEVIVDVISTVHGINVGEIKRAKLTTALTRHFRQKGATMAKTWYQEIAPAVHRILADAANGVEPWSAELLLLDKTVGKIAHEAVYVAAKIGVSKTENIR